MSRFFNEGSGTLTVEGDVASAMLQSLMQPFVDMWKQLGIPLVEIGFMMHGAVVESITTSTLRNSAESNDLGRSILKELGKAMHHAHPHSRNEGDFVPTPSVGSEVHRL